jgi:hypothetical protein
VARRRPRLTTVGAVLRELGYVYRRADAGKMPWADAAQAARILREVRFCLEASDFELRLQRLEAAAEADDWPRPNGAAGHHARH